MDGKGLREGRNSKGLWKSVEKMKCRTSRVARKTCHPKVERGDLRATRLCRDLLTNCPEKSPGS